MFRSLAGSILVCTCAHALHWCQDGHREDGSECVDLISAFLEDVLDMPKKMSSRRLLSANENIHVEGATIGEQFAFLVEVAMHGNQTTAGWHLHGGRRLHTSVGTDMANLVDAMILTNDDGNDLTKTARQNAENDLYAKAQHGVVEAMGKNHDSKKANTGACEVLERPELRDSRLKPKIQGLLKGPKVRGVIDDNGGIIGWADKAVKKYTVPIVNGLRWMGSRVKGWFGLYDARAPSSILSLKFTSTAQGAKLVSLMMAGMITSFATVVVGIRHARKLSLSMKSRNENGIVDDVEYEITGTGD